MAEFGFSEVFLSTRPDIKAIVDKATDAGWTMDKFLDEVRTTKWWKNLSDAQKSFDVERAENPGEIQRKIAAAQVMIRSMATRMGYTTDSASAVARKYAIQAVRNGWGEDEIRLYVGGAYQKGGAGGMIGTTKQRLTQMASDYGINFGTGPTLTNWTRAVLQGVRTVEDYDNVLKEQAKKHYRAVASDFDAGFTLREILEPYLQTAAQELGVNPATLDLTKAGLWTAAVQYVPKGEREARAMSQDEWVARMRTDSRYGYDKTQGAQKQGAELVNGIARAFGGQG